MITQIDIDMKKQKAIYYTPYGTYTVEIKTKLIKLLRISNYEHTLKKHIF